MEGNHRFMRGVLEPHPVVGLRKRLAEGQHPKVGILACADSRVAPEIVFDKNLGDLFVVRVAGNVAEPLGVASLEYGVEHLGVKLLLVIGHESCGAVAAAASGEPMPTKNLTALVAAIRPAIESVPKGGTPAEVSLRQVEANVRATARTLLEMSSVFRHEVDDKKLTILRGVYHLESGEVTRFAD